MHVNQIFQARPSRAQRRSKADRAQRTHSFSRSWRRGGALHVAVMASLLPLGLIHSAHAQATNTFTAGSGDWSTAGNWSLNAVPDGTGGTYYAVVNPMSSTLSHNGSTGPGGVDTIYSMDNEGAFSLNGGILAGSQTAMASTFVNNGSFTVSGGTLRNFTVSGNAVSFADNSGNFLDSDTFQTNLTVPDAYARLENSLTVASGSAVNISGGGYVTAATNTTLSGAVDFTDGNGGNVLGTENGDTLTLASGSLVHGITGQVGVAENVAGSGTLVNHGTISSDGGGTITLNAAAGTTSNGTLQAKNASTLVLSSGPVNATGGTLNIQDTSVIQNNGIDLTGGTVTGSGRMTFTGGTSDFLTGVTFNGATLDLTNDNYARFSNGLTLEGGSVAKVAGGSYLTADASTTLSGTVDFTDGNGGNVLGTENGDTLTLAAGSLVHGITGQVGVDELVGGNGTVVNDGTILSDGGGTITINPVTLNNGATGTIQANGGSVTISPVLNNAGTVLVNAGNTITANNGETQTAGVTQVDGTFTANNAPVTINGGTLKGTGTINGNVASTGGTVSPGDSTGTLTITGNYSQDPTSALDVGYTASADPTFTPTNSTLDVNGAVTLGGTLNVAFLGPATPGVGYLAVAGENGTGPFDFLNYGSLTNTDFGTLFSNEYMVGGDYFVNGIAGDDVAGVPAVYQLTGLDNLTGGGQLDLKLTTLATPEPSQWAAFGLGFLGLGGLALRARRRAAA